MKRKKKAARRVKPFQALQLRFAAHLRDPRRAPPAGIEPRRLKVYSELFYNNIESFLSSGFPVLRRITPEARWHAMVRDFYARHRSRQPLFQAIALEFLDYLETERGKVREDPPFLVELAHYEWVELALSLSTVELTPLRADPAGELIEGVPVLSPLAWPQTYDFPVHRIGPGFQPTQPGSQATHLVVWRNRRDEVKFMECNAVSARLLQLLATGRATGRATLQRVARELGQDDSQAVIADGSRLLQDFRERDIILGTRPGRFRRRPSKEMH